MPKKQKERKSLSMERPKYMGSNNPNSRQRDRETRQQYFDWDKEFTDSVISISNRHGISPEVVASRIADEGPVDEAIRAVNAYVLKQRPHPNPISSGDDYYGKKEPIWFNNYHDGTLWGLDDTSTNLEKGLVTVPPGGGRFSYSTLDFTNELGRDTESVWLDNWYSGIEATAGELKYRKEEMKKQFPGRSDEWYDKAAAAAFNRGINGAISYIKKGKSIEKYAPYIKIRRSLED